MAKYKVVVEGKNFKIELERVVQKLGFFTTRYVESDSSTLAENDAMSLIRNELKKVVLNDVSDPPTMFVDAIDEITSFKDMEIPGSGFSWFQEE